ncbi:MAG: CDP-alcohol phosphatidyltransferase family protein [Chloroflexi bacterium]|nr:CDP-alcohol phosphatidyltransferase family protein [Chloroflexota bacterium]
MMDGALRQVKEKILLPVAQQIGCRMSPTTLTLMAGAAGGLAAVAGWQGNSLLGLGLWWVNRTLDGLDGTVARVSGRQSDLGHGSRHLLQFVFSAARMVPAAVVPARRAGRRQHGAADRLGSPVFAIEEQ